MKSLKIALLLATAPLLSDCFSWEFGLRMGYRWDELQHFLYDEGNSTQISFQEDFDNLSTAQVAGFTTLRLWWLELSADADYGWTVGGHVKSIDYIKASPTEIKTALFNSDASGEVWDAFFTGGLRVPFYNRCDRGFFITPLGGYSFHGIREKRRTLRPLSRDIGEVEILGGAISDPTFVSVPDTKRLERDYKGPFAGVGLSIIYCRFYTNFGYAYHWIDLEQTLDFERQIEFFTASDLAISEAMIQNQFDIERNRGNRGWLSLNYQDLCGWRVGLRGTYFSVSTNKGSSYTTSIDRLSSDGQTEQITTLARNQAKARWQTFTVMIEGAYSF